MKVTSCRRPRLPRTAVKALHRRSFFSIDRTEPAYPIGGFGLRGKVAHPGVLDIGSALAGVA
jgi:hypothetical protein